jgi:hypothetical protein
MGLRIWVTIAGTFTGGLIGGFVGVIISLANSGNWSWLWAGLAVGAIGGVIYNHVTFENWKKPGVGGAPIGSTEFYVHENERRKYMQGHD